MRSSDFLNEQRNPETSWRIGDLLLYIRSYLQLAAVREKIAVTRDKLYRTNNLPSLEYEASVTT